jgi:hypothetical protein
MDGTCEAVHTCTQTCSIGQLYKPSQKVAGFKFVACVILSFSGLPTCFFFFDFDCFLFLVSCVPVFTCVLDYRLAVLFT